MTAEFGPDRLAPSNDLLCDHWMAIASTTWRLAGVRFPVSDWPKHLLPLATTSNSSSSPSSHVSHRVVHVQPNESRAATEPQTASMAPAMQPMRPAPSNHVHSLPVLKASTRLRWQHF